MLPIAVNTFNNTENNKFNNLLRMHTYNIYTS